MATVAELQSQVRLLQDRLRIAQNGLARLNRSLQSNQAIIARYEQEVATIPGEIRSIESQIAAIQKPPSQSAARAAQSAAPQGPNKAPPQTLEAETPPAGNTDTGTNASVRTTEQTQATNGYDISGNATGLNVRGEDGTLSNLRQNPETGELYDPGGLPGGAELKTKSGTITNDDAANNSTTTKQTDVNAANNTTIKVTAQPNVLDDFYSYTYSASIYIC